MRRIFLKRVTCRELGAAFDGWNYRRGGVLPHIRPTAELSVHPWRGARLCAT